MKDEPELIDLFAVFIAAGLASNNAKSHNFAELTYNLAAQMMRERKNNMKDSDAKQTWQPLTDEEYQDILNYHRHHCLASTGSQDTSGLILFYNLIESKLKEKNSYKKEMPQ